MKTIFEIKNGKMIPESLQPLADYMGLSATAVATYLNIKIGFMGATFAGFFLTPIFNGILTIVISGLSIIWIAMKIYDQFLITKERKELRDGQA